MAVAAALPVPKRQELGAHALAGFVKEKLNLLWLHILLRKIARKDAEFFMRFVGEFCDTEKQLKIMQLRYVEKLQFKQIPEKVFVEERQVYKLHKKVIDQLLKL